MEGTRRRHWLPAAESEQTAAASKNLVECFLKIRRVLGDIAPYDDIGTGGLGPTMDDLTASACATETRQDP